MDRGAGDESAQVFRRDRDQPLPRFERRPGDMRRDQAVFRAKQRVFRGDRLDRDDVDRRAADLPRIQRVGDVAFIQDWPAAGVDQDNAVLHFRDAIPINESDELRRQRGVQRDEIRSGEKFVDRYIFRDRFPFFGLRPAGGDHVHSERARYPPDGFPDPSEAEDPERFPRQLDQRTIQLEGKIDRPLPVAAMDRAVERAYPIRGLEKERENVLRSGFGSVAGDIRDGNSAFRGGGDVNDVISGRQDADIFNRWAAVQDFTGQRRFIREDGFGAADPLDDSGEILMIRPIVDGQLSERFEFLPAQVAGIRRPSVKNDYFHT